MMWKKLTRPPGEATDLKEQTSIRLETDALPIGQSQQLVIIHHAVHALNPHSVHIAIKQDVPSFILHTKAIVICGPHGHPSSQQDIMHIMGLILW